MVLIGDICQVLAGQGHDPLTKQAVANLVADGMPGPERGRFDVDACISWYIARLRTSAKRKVTETKEGKSLSLDTELTRLTKAKADNEEMTAAERTGELICVSDYETDVARWIQITKLNLLNIPGRLAPKIHDLTTSEQKALIRAAAKQAMGVSKSFGVIRETRAEAPQ
jgi:phage terminase Nu1 subunit (DNA packaging protein)